MKSFDDWFKELTSDTLWYELLRAYKDETIKKAGERVFASLVADGTVEARPMSENRKHVYNILVKNPGDKVLKPWYQQEAEKKALANPLADPNCPHCKGSGGVKTGEDEYSTCPCVNPWIPITGEERQKRLKEWEAIVKGSTMANSMPKPSYKQLAEEGGVLPPKPAPYPCTSKEEAYVRDRHFEYIKANFEARTAQKLPSWICEEDWNTIYDENHLTDKGL